MTCILMGQSVCLSAVVLQYETVVHVRLPLSVYGRQPVTRRLPAMRRDVVPKNPWTMCSLSILFVNSKSLGQLGE